MTIATDAPSHIDTLRREAQRLYQHGGLSPIPCIPGEKRPALPSWKEFITKRPTVSRFSEIWDHCAANTTAMGTPCGRVAGGLCVVDFDVPRFFDAWRAAVGQLGDGLVYQKTGSGGHHVYLRCDDPGKSQQLAWAPSDEADSGREVAIETRAEGGFIVVSPSMHPDTGALYEVTAGDLADIPHIDQARFEALLAAARKLDEAPLTIEQKIASATIIHAPRPAGNNGTIRPGDDFDTRGDVPALLTKHGWKFMGGTENQRWRRPGKKEGCSATLKTIDGIPVFYVHSSNAAPFEIHGYAPFAVYALLEHGGNWAAAAGALRREGFGGGHDGGGAVVDLSEFKAGGKVAEAAETAGKPTTCTTGEIPILICMADVEPREVTWLWPGRVPMGRITLLVGRPGEGKSFLTTYMAAAVSNGRKWPDGGECPKGSVMLLNAEDDPHDTTRPRLNAHNADPAKIHVLDAVQYTDQSGNQKEVVFTLDRLRVLEKAIQQLPDLRLLVVDPVGSYLGGQADAHRDNEVRGVLAPVAKLAEQYGFALLIVMHRRKSGGGTADESAMGSRAFTGIARAVWHLSRDPDDKDRRLFLPGKNNLAKEGKGLAFTIDGEPASLRWEEGAVEMNADDGMAAELAAGAEKPGPKPEARNNAVDWLERVLTDANAEMEVAAVKKEAAGAGHAWRTVQRAADQLGVERVRDKATLVWRWVLPPFLTMKMKMPTHVPRAS